MLSTWEACVPASRDRLWLLLLCLSSSMQVCLVLLLHGLFTSHFLRCLMVPSFTSVRPPEHMAPSTRTLDTSSLCSFLCHHLLKYSLTHLLSFLLLCCIGMCVLQKWKSLFSVFNSTWSRAGIREMGTYPPQSWASCMWSADKPSGVISPTGCGDD